LYPAGYRISDWPDIRCIPNCYIDFFLLWMVIPVNENTIPYFC
jgi:hypothetical protein